MPHVCGVPQGDGRLLLLCLRNIRDRRQQWSPAASNGAPSTDFFAYCSRCMWMVLNNFFLVYEPPHPWRGSWVQTPGQPPPICPLAGEDLAVFALDRLISGICYSPRRGY